MPAPPAYGTKTSDCQGYEIWPGYLKPSKNGLLILKPNLKNKQTLKTKMTMKIEIQKILLRYTEVVPPFKTSSNSIPGDTIEYCET